MGDMKTVYKIVIGNPEGKSHLEDLRVDEMITLK
jgi:hypothetical protein